ncbi:MAG: hypothetical protein MZU97_03585 [Bacillus subtilis]|nr:hypothetical protein [Bacillus subtilis]
MINNHNSNPKKIDDLNRFLETLKVSQGEMKTKHVMEHRGLLDAVTPFDLLFLNDYQAGSLVDNEVIIDESGKVVNVFF